MTAPIPLLTVREVLAELRIGRSTLYREVGRGRLKLTKVGGATRIRRTELDRYLDARTRGRRGRAG